jgi:hypothetical protein
MKTIKISEATPLQLNWLVAKCEGYRPEHCADTIFVGGDYHEEGYSPTTDPAQMWPIIDRIDGVQMKRWVESRPNLKCQVEIHNYDGDTIQFGPTLLIAAARCYVASKLGDTAEVPEELT